MKLKGALEGQEVVAPIVWRQLKVAIHTIGQQYGVHIQFADDITLSDEIDRIWWETVAQYERGPA